MPIFQATIESLHGKAQEDIELTGPKLKDFILGDKTYCNFRTEEVCKGNIGDPVVEGSTFGWIIHGGNYSSDQCMFTKETSGYERLYTLDVLGVEDRSENDQLDVYLDFQENITKTTEGRYQVSVP